MKRDSQGTFTLYDAGLFFVFLMIASSLVTVYAFKTNSTIDERLSKAEYCEDARSAFLSANIPSTGYDTGQGYVERKDASVRALLLEQIYLEEKGIPRDNFSYPSDISELGRNQFGKGWGILVSKDGSDDLIINFKGASSDLYSLKRSLGEDFTTSSWKEDGLEGKSVEIIFFYGC
ncbi:MAG: hypothetical protein ACQESD_06175 [Thermoplasmatota archaeon]